jgi:hypothetical protein
MLPDVPADHGAVACEIRNYPKRRKKFMSASAARTSQV